MVGAYIALDGGLPLSLGMSPFSSISPGSYLFIQPTSFPSTAPSFVDSLVFIQARFVINALFFSSTFGSMKLVCCVSEAEEWSEVALELT